MTNGLEVLIVDDEQMVRNTLRKMLERAGHRVQEAEDGVQALQFLEKRSPDLVICDIIMPNMEGIETLREVKKLSPKVKVIVISGGARSGSLNYLSVAEKLGADAVMDKPFGSKKLIDTIAAIFTS
jgi:CheY-like chemotaxis protein